MKNTKGLIQNNLYIYNKLTNEKSHLLLKEKYDLLLPHLDEKSRRLYLSSETICLGRGGKSLVSRLTKVSRMTLTSGEKELHLEPGSQHKKAVPTDRQGIRKKGGGRKKASALDSTLVQAVKDLVPLHTRRPNASFIMGKKKH